MTGAAGALGDEESLLAVSSFFPQPTAEKIVKMISA
jgi:hypothetical protein